MSILSSSRCVLIMGDEGLQVFNVKSSSAKQIDFIPWETEGFEATVSNLILKKCGGTPVVVLNDMVEQHYRKERVPKVSFFDRANVMKRRLNVAFPNYKVRSALRIKDKGAPQAEKAKGLPYLFAAIPASNAFNKTLAAVALSNASIVGFFLLPIEASVFVKDLSDKLNKNKKYKAAWTIFVGQHHNGGLRQIVTRNGELALTRLTPIVDTDVEPDLWAKEVSGEVDATMSYLARFGYKPTDGLDVIVVSGEGAKDSLENAIKIDCDLTVMTSLEVSKILKAGLGGQDDYRYADVLHAAYLGKKKSFKLPLEAVAITELVQPRRIASFVAIGLLLGVAYLGYVTFTNWKKAADVKDQYVVAQQQKKALDEEYDLVLDRQKALGFDLRLIINSVKIYEEFEGVKVEPLPIVRAIGQAIGVDIRLDELDFSLEEEAKASADPYAYNPMQEKDTNLFLDAVMKISFPSSVRRDLSVARVDKIVSELQKALPEDDVEILKQVADLSYTGNVSGESGAASGISGPEQYTAEIKVRRLLK